VRGEVEHGDGRHLAERTHEMPISCELPARVQQFKCLDYAMQISEEG
jgi:hypothetical protein